MSDAVCPLRDVTWDYDDNDQLKATAETCGASLYLVASMSVPLEKGDTTIAMKDVSHLATTSTWAVECENGHRIAVSSRSSDDSEDFVWNTVFGDA